MKGMSGNSLSIKLFDVSASGTFGIVYPEVGFSYKAKGGVVSGD